MLFCCGCSWAVGVVVLSCALGPSVPQGCTHDVFRRGVVGRPHPCYVRPQLPEGVHYVCIRRDGSTCKPAAEAPCTPNWLHTHALGAPGGLPLCHLSLPSNTCTHARMHARTHTKTTLTGRCYLVRRRCGGAGRCPGSLYLARFWPDGRRFVRLSKAVLQRLGIHTIREDIASELVRLSVTSVPSIGTDAHPAGCVCGGQFTADVCQSKLQLRAIEQSRALAVA